ncbi:MAG: carbohydrate-binding protein CenC [Burkholderiales bacterium PBB3]|nr:MAG: carbohydrate-binding protein CenC [Burkholderiales bacterium PBB3]
MTYPGATAGQPVVWELSLLDPAGKLVQQWSGEDEYQNQAMVVNVPWEGRIGKLADLPDGNYGLQLKARAPNEVVSRFAKGTRAERVSTLLALEGGHAAIEQRWDIAVGNPPKPNMPAFAAMAVGEQGELARRYSAKSVSATNSLPYTVYYANLHSQTNDSDGGGAIGSCTSSQPAQTGAFGPAAAFSYAKTAGLDVLATTEHNHYFDGSSSTNTGASPATARSRYQAGLSAANSFNTSNPSFLALYGMEWGVISNGGHLNIFNSNELFSWEYSASNELFGDRFVAKNDYAALYGVMRQQGLVGQFNHPESTGQFLVGGTDLGYSADGDEVMVLAEVLGTSAFSANTTETETGRSNWEAVFNKILERGFHVAPSSNQDNHCANWGKAYTNRTGVLLPAGTVLSKASFVAALKARRVFASMDKNSQVVLQANGRIMGERFTNSGPLNLNVLFANTAGRTAASVQILEGVPGRNGTVSTLASSATSTTTPAVGQHFYYAKVTQDDGKVLWSAPIWVTQTTGGTTPDTTVPVAGASESGTSGTITLSATASDNVGVTRVDFLIDNVVKGSDTTAPYALAFDSSTLTNGSHSLVARAYDAAGNSGASSAVAFTINNVGAVYNEVESNGSIAAANVLATQTTVSGTMGNASDIDFFKLTLTANKKLRIDMTGPSGTDYDLYLVNGSGTVLASSEGSTSSELLNYTNGTAISVVYIKVISYSGSSTTQRYNLSLSFP